MTDSTTQYDVIVIGAGMTGFGAAQKLRAAGKRVLILERAPDLGGLVASHRRDGFTIEKFYHHSFWDDFALIDLIKEFGLEANWTPHHGSTGYLVDRTVYRMDTPIDIFIKFKPMSLADKFRLGLAVLKIKRITDFAPFDDVSAKEWLIANCGRGVYEGFFEAPLLGKFGQNVDDISAAWLLTRIKLRSNRSVGKGETLYYLEGGYQTFVDAWVQRLQAGGVEIRLRCGVEQVLLENGRCVGVRTTDGENISAPVVISSLSPQLLQQVAPFDGDYQQRLAKIKFQASICCLAGLTKSLLPTYWCNIKSKHFPFPLLLEHTNFHQSTTYNCHLMYAATYVQDFADPLWQLADEEIEQKFKAPFYSVFGLQPADFLWFQVARAPYSAPVYRRGYLGNLPPVETPFAGLFATGMMHSYPERSINDSIRRGYDAAERALKY